MPDVVVVARQVGTGHVSRVNALAGPAWSVGLAAFRHHNRSDDDTKDNDDEADQVDLAVLLGSPVESKHPTGAIDASSNQGFTTLTGTHRFCRERCSSSAVGRNDTGDADVGVSPHWLLNTLGWRMEPLMGHVHGMRRGRAIARAVLVLCVASQVGGCSHPDRPCPEPGVPGHSGDYLASDLSGANAVDCALVGKVARQGDLAVTIPAVGEGVSVTGAPTADGRSPGALTVRTDSSGVITVVFGT